MSSCKIQCKQLLPPPSEQLGHQYLKGSPLGWLSTPTRNQLKMFLSVSREPPSHNSSLKTRQSPHSATDCEIPAKGEGSWIQFRRNSSYLKKRKRKKEEECKREWVKKKEGGKGLNREGRKKGKTKEENGSKLEIQHFELGQLQSSIWFHLKSFPCYQNKSLRLKTVSFLSHDLDPIVYSCMICGLCKAQFSTHDLKLLTLYMVFSPLLSRMFVFRLDSIGMRDS